MNVSVSLRRWSATTASVNGNGRRSHSEPLPNRSRVAGDQPVVRFREFSQ